MEKSSNTSLIPVSETPIDILNQKKCLVSLAIFVKTWSDGFGLYKIKTL